ncbi:hypothetical protein ABW20_dc0109466 [Dactylellina cionopaga]|nr:hypothetical protein ABW20_dc0109466 [Dactylellina cionopaga]
MAQLMDLPNEILSLIFGYVAPPGKSTLAALCLLNSRLTAHVLLALYHSIELPYNEYTGFTERQNSSIFNTENPNIYYIKRLSIRREASSQISDEGNDAASAQMWSETLQQVTDTVQSLLLRLSPNQLVAFE